mmetsp:Transcript_35408/g.58181  ORF Transcript_35408/g.58181 Transcript_35408/m.58181 type:complete len:114 (+) Transcript_35408:3-344(+)
MSTRFCKSNKYNINPTCEMLVKAMHSRPKRDLVEPWKNWLDTFEYRAHTGKPASAAEKGPMTSTMLHFAQQQRTEGSRHTFAHSDSRIFHIDCDCFCKFLSIGFVKGICELQC